MKRAVEAETSLIASGRRDRHSYERQMGIETFVGWSDDILLAL